MRTVLAALAASRWLAAPAGGRSRRYHADDRADGLGTATLTPDLADFTAGVVAAGTRRPRARGSPRTAGSPPCGASSEAAGVADADIRTVGLSVSRERVKAARPLPARSRRSSCACAPSRGRGAARRRGHGRRRRGGRSGLRVRRPVRGARCWRPGPRSPTHGGAPTTPPPQAGMRITGVRSVDLDPNLESIGGDSGVRTTAPPLRRPAGAPRPRRRPGRRSSWRRCGWCTRPPPCEWSLGKPRRLLHGAQPPRASAVDLTARPRARGTRKQQARRVADRGVAGAIMVARGCGVDGPVVAVA